MIISIKEINEYGGDKTAKDKTLQRTFRAQSDIIGETVESIMSDAACPRIRDPHPSIDNCYVDKVSVKTAEDEKVFKITADYKMMFTNAAGDGDNEDPTKQPPEIDYDFDIQQIVADKAYNSGDAQGTPTKPVQNSALDPFDPPLMRDRARMIISVSYNVRTFDPNTAANFQDTVNNSQITVAGIKIGYLEGRLKKIVPKKKFDSKGVEYWNIKAEILIDRETHRHRVLDQGYAYWDGGNKLYFSMSDIDSDISPGSAKDTQVNDPQKLDGDGGKLPGGKTATPVYLTYCCYFPRNWSTLGLPEKY